VTRTAGAAGMVALLLALSTAPAEAQARPGAEPYMGVMVGAHTGINYLFEGFLIGGQAVFLLDPWGRVSFIPNAQYEIRRGLRDWQANLDGALMPVPGVYVGGGVSYRNSIFDEEVGRETVRGASFFFGYRPPPVPGRIVPHIELRWSFIGDIRPRMLTAGVSFPLVLFR
jgi:hypothetical protein